MGFYQLCKVLITPTLLAVEFSWLGKRPGRVALLSTGVLLLGVSIATLLDKQARARGAAAAALRVLAHSPASLACWMPLGPNPASTLD